MVTKAAKLSSGSQANQNVHKILTSWQVKSLFNTLAEFQSNWNNNYYSMRNYKTDANLLLTAIYLS